MMEKGEDEQSIEEKLAVFKELNSPSQMNAFVLRYIAEYPEIEQDVQNVIESIYKAANYSDSGLPYRSDLIDDHVGGKKTGLGWNK